MYVLSLTNIVVVENINFEIIFFNTQFEFSAGNAEEVKPEKQ